MEAAGKGFKSFIAVVLVLSLLPGQIQVEAKSCCPSMYARNVYNACRVRGNPQSVCAKMSGCKIVQGKCDDPYYNSLHSDSDEANALEFCKLGCAASVCDNIQAVFRFTKNYFSNKFFLFIPLTKHAFQCTIHLGKVLSTCNLNTAECV
ncbi:hypothetical protein HU200_044960 [Digitaria exilis]|uniref:Acidic protein n=1 Tax=Digitaria exilis TaxID=1010633 RepID=A0A835B1T5_9POAL|nr:hypothetical protein HU200_044960 [Digitaria exilis]